MVCDVAAIIKSSAQPQMGNRGGVDNNRRKLWNSMSGVVSRESRLSLDLSQKGGAGDLNHQPED